MATEASGITGGASGATPDREVSCRLERSTIEPENPKRPRPSKRKTRKTRKTRKPPPKDPFAIRLGRGIRTLRTRQGIARKDLAEQLEVTYAQLGFWERGTSKPQVWVLVRLVKILGTTFEHLLAEEEPPPPRIRIPRNRKFNG